MKKIIWGEEAKEILAMEKPVLWAAREINQEGRTGVELDIRDETGFPPSKHDSDCECKDCFKKEELESEVERERQWEAEQEQVGETETEVSP